MKKLYLALVAVLLRFALVEGAASTLYFPDYVVGSGWSVQLALGNIDTVTAAEVVVEVYDQDGAPIRSCLIPDRLSRSHRWAVESCEAQGRGAFGAAGSGSGTLRARSGDC